MAIERSNKETPSSFYFKTRTCWQCYPLDSVKLYQGSSPNATGQMMYCCWYCLLSSFSFLFASAEEVLKPEFQIAEKTTLARLAGEECKLCSHQRMRTLSCRRLGKDLKLSTTYPETACCLIEYRGTCVLCTMSYDRCKRSLQSFEFGIDLPS